MVQGVHSFIFADHVWIVHDSGGVLEWNHDWSCDLWLVRYCTVPNLISPYIYTRYCTFVPHPLRWITRSDVIWIWLSSTFYHGHGKSFPKFTAKEYGPIYRRILAMIKEVLNDAYHGPRLSAQLREWAEAGWQE
jgi:hypothetical protein